MKKTAILFAAVGFGLAGSLSGCASDEDFTAQQYAAEGEVVSLSVDVSDRAVKLMPSEDGKLRIDYYESGKTSYDISLSEEGVLSVTLDLDQTQRTGISRERVWEAGTITRSPATSKRARVRCPRTRRAAARRFLWTATTATLRSKSQTRKFYLSCARKNTDVIRPCFFRPEVRP